MQLELIGWEKPEPGWSFKDPNIGQYDKALDYFWDYSNQGYGIDLFKWGVMVTLFFITPSDVALFPELAGVSQVVLWEDEEEGVKMLMLKPEARCFLCKDELLNHREEICDGLY